ncbi:hypothetical protein J7E52_11995 [Bacillus sp. ISL-34]|uniref:hypothetical protein n=1 Tax=Bacillus sp. ISL-34 TaxID=2819121 RepID=UPI001BECB852|nr:hypothetical protein [Bacillus sp. ISL-34]MBT2647438.1 hypothetical protein [Bacillus sp. ISL-34]
MALVPAVFGKQGETSSVIRWARLSLSAFTSHFPEVVKALIISDVTRGAAVVSMKESKRKLLNGLKSIKM